MSKLPRVFRPLILETKQQLLAALKQGKLKSAKYNLLSKEEKLFVEMLVFGGYTAEQAMRAIKPTLKCHAVAGRRMLINPDVAEALSELTVQKDKKFMAEISSARDLALEKLTYIMNTTADEDLAIKAAKVIMDKSEKILLDEADKDDKVDGVRMRIEVDNIYVNPVTNYNPAKKMPIDIPTDCEIIDQDGDDVEEGKLATPGESGLKYTLNYEEIDSYSVDKEE